MRLRVLSGQLARLAVYGIRVFPMPAGAKFPPPAGWQTTTVDLADLQPGENAGVGCRLNDLVVLDVDHPAELNTYCTGRGVELPATLTVSTPGGGHHLYYRATAGRIFPSVSQPRGPLPGTDVRAPGRRSGGFVVAPGSSISGRAYEITVDHQPSQMPVWLADLLAARRS